MDYNSWTRVWLVEMHRMIHIQTENHFSTIWNIFFLRSNVGNTLQECEWKMELYF